MDSNSPASPFPPIAQYAFLSDCHTGALVAPDGSVDWLCAPTVRQPERVRQPARPRRRLLPVRAVRHQRADVARLRPRHERARHHVAHAVGVGRGPRRAHHGPARGSRRDDAAHPPARRRRRRAPAGADRHVPRGVRADRARVRPGVRLRPDAGAVGPRRAGGHTADISGAGLSMRLHTDLALGRRGRRAARPARARRGRDRVLRAVVGRLPGRARPTRTTPSRGSRRRATSGAAGSAAP